MMGTPSDSWPSSPTTSSSHWQARMGSSHRASRSYDGSRDWEKRCQQLERQNLILLTEIATLKNAYETLVNKIPALLLATSQLEAVTKPPELLALPPLQQADYSQVKFWVESTWKAHSKSMSSVSSTSSTRRVRGGTAASQGVKRQRSSSRTSTVLPSTASEPKTSVKLLIRRSSPSPPRTWLQNLGESHPAMSLSSSTWRWQGKYLNSASARITGKLVVSPSTSIHPGTTTTDPTNPQR